MTYLDWGIVLCFLLAVVALALRSGRSSSSISDYFLARRNLHSWIVVASVLATEVSAATVVGAPDTAFATSIAYLQTTIGAVLSRFILAYFFIEVFYNAEVVTVYEFLGHRFGPRSQKYSALVYSFGRIAASAARLYIAAYAISIVVGIAFQVSILLVGILALAYSVFGGLRAVAITDTLQGFVFLFFGILVLWVSSISVGGIFEVTKQAYQAGKLEIFVFDWDIFQGSFWLNPYTFIAGVLGGLFLGLATHGTDQDMVQRLLAARSSREARRSMIAVGLLEIPIALLFVFVGVSLWSFFQVQEVAPPKGVSVLPFYVRDFLGTGYRGLFVAAVLAAALSSLDSVINALSSVWVTDLSSFSFEKERIDRPLGQFWKTSIYIAGLLVLVALALGYYHQYIISLEVNSLNRRAELLTLALGVMSTIYGPLLGVFLVGLFTKRGTDFGAMLAIFTTLVVTLVLQFSFGDIIGWTWRIIVGSMLSFVICFTVGFRNFSTHSAILSHSK